MRLSLTPVFVTLEGPEGSGKSTLAMGLARRIQATGQEVVLTREPGAGVVGQAIRQILLHGAELTPTCETFLFLADRAQHVSSVVRPALASGAWVLCDRFSDSTVVYQGYARGGDLEALRRWNEAATGGLRPDLTLLLDLDPAIGLGRLQNPDRLDREPIEFHMRVREGFLAEAAREPDRWVTIDASQHPEAVLEATWSAVEASVAN
ncbi:MAG: dTMP kinase [Fimbriimonadaceae bacterium]|nr:dTMP kinase [Fimbriimonadaceae bacterium]QYK57668.1 MAG: dTMP kinase [Fimbriimonadaceae bacterium]